MNNTGYIALSRQTTLMRQMDVVANNIANANTSGFKGEQVMFVEHLAQPTADMPMSFVEDIAVARDMQPGNLTATHGQLDLAINGEGWFVVETPAGNRYTRAGGFQLDSERRVVNSQGYALLDEGDRPITLPADARDVTVTRDGTISADGIQVAKVRLAAFENEQLLRKTAGGLYTTTAEPQASKAEVMQGMIEQSNVQPIIEMTRMMDVLRAFQANQNMLDTEHEREMRAIRELPTLQNA